jgi:hypothetical protein
MQAQTAFCSACDKDVRIIITDEPSQDGHANLHESEVVCLEIGDHCTGALCPIGAASPTIMAARLVRNGLQTVIQPLITATCPGCGRETKQLVVDPGRATCLECGSIFDTQALPKSAPTA